MQFLYYFLYNFLVSLYYLFYFLLSPFLLMINSKKVKQRLGLFKVSRKDYWIHAVSSGEIILANFIISLNSSKTFLITLMSNNGYKLAKKLYQNHKKVAFYYLPFDLYPISKKLVKQVSPKKFFVIEHDLWPNLLNHLHKNKIKRILLNVALKPKDLFYLKKLPSLAKFIYQVDEIFFQNKSYENSLKPFLSYNTTLKTIGNLKYTKALLQKKINQNPLKAFKQNHQFIITLGSTHPKEEKQLIKAIEKWIGNKVTVIIIPRNPNRAISLCRYFSKQYKVIIYSKWLFSKNKKADILIIDQMGISLECYNLSEIVLIGDTFLPSQGGHNFLEPLSLQKTTFYGNFMISYLDITSYFEKEKGVIRLLPNKIEETLTTYILNKQKRLKLAKKGKQCLEKIMTNEATIKKNLFN